MRAGIIVLTRTDLRHIFVKGLKGRQKNLFAVLVS